MFSVIKFEKLTGHEPQTAACGTLWSASVNCTCDGKGQVFACTEDTLDDALKRLHEIIYRWHCQIVYIRQGGKCSRCGGLCKSVTTGRSLRLRMKIP